MCIRKPLEVLKFMQADAVREILSYTRTDTAPRRTYLVFSFSLLLDVVYPVCGTQKPGGRGRDVTLLPR